MKRRQKKDDKKVVKRQKKQRQETEEVEEQAEEQVTQPKKKKVIEGPPAVWVLTTDMSFGIIDQSFRAGTVFTVDWQRRVMRCEENGRVFENIRDMEIAIRLNKVIPRDEEGFQEQANSIKTRREHEDAKKAEQQRSSQVIGEDLRARVVESDEDLIGSIDISHTKRLKKASDTVINTTPASPMSLLKPRYQKKMEVIRSDSFQESVRVSPIKSAKTVKRPEVRTTEATVRPDESVLAGKHEWDTTKDSGKITAMVNRKMSDYRIIVLDNGQQIIRGMPVVRDDASSASVSKGEISRNAGMVQYFTKEEMASRNEQARARAGELRSDAEEKRKKNKNSGQEDMSRYMAREVEPGDSLDEEVVHAGEQTSEPRVSEKVGRLLRRRY